MVDLLGGRERERVRERECCDNDSSLLFFFLLLVVLFCNGDMFGGFGRRC